MSLPSSSRLNPASRAAFRASVALIAEPSNQFFRARIGSGDLRPYRPHRPSLIVVIQHLGADASWRAVAQTVRIIGDRPLVGAR